MQPKFSIRARLTLYFAVSFGIIIVSLAVAAYVLVYRAAYAKLDSQLRAAVDATAMSAGHELAEHEEQAAGEADLQTVLLESRDAALPGTQILVTYGTRQVAYRAGGADLPDLRKLPLIPADAFSSQGMRIACREFVVPRFSAPYKIYSAAPIAPATARLRGFRLALLIYLPLGLAVASLVGYLLARRALAPLSAFADTIDSIKSSDLSARISDSGCSDEICRLAQRFNSLLERLELAFDLQRRFMADASHELRTPVSIALSAAQVTKRDSHRNTSDSAQSLELIERQMLRLKRILSDMLFLSQADATPLAPIRKEIHFDDVISAACSAALALARAKDQTLNVGPLPEARCFADFELLKQALLILLDNSTKFMDARGEVSVTLFQRAEMWACRVTDSGPGIPAEAQPRIFERFYRAQPSNTSAGSGLGLAIAKSIVESHGGQLVLLNSTPGQTIFEMTIPALAAMPASITGHVDVEAYASNAKA